MPKIGKHARALPVRVSEQGHALLVTRAAKESRGNVSELVRRMLKYAVLHMPAGWK